MLRRVASAVLVGGLLGFASFAAAAQRPAVPPGPVTFLGIAGLRWSDITPTATPALWQVAEHAALGALAVRTTESGTCPLDGWLTLNSGTRSAAPRPGGSCAAIPAPAVADGVATVPGWAALTAPNSGDEDAPRWGTLAGRRPGTSAPTRACAVGAGAAVALADPDGRAVAEWGRTPGPLGLGTDCPLRVVDAGALPEGAGRPAALTALDATVRPFLSSGALVVAGIADSAPGQPHLTALLVRPDTQGYDPANRPVLRSESTRQPGLLQLTDLTPTLLRGSVPDDLTGARLETRSAHTDPAKMRRRDIGARTVHNGFVLFFVVFIGGQILGFAALAAAWQRRRLSRVAAGRAALQIGLLAGAVPAASFLVNALPWTHAEHPGLVLWCAIAGVAIVLASAAFSLRRHPAAPAALLGAVTLGVLSADVATGSRLQLDAVFGLSTLVAGRFYGFGNIAFAVFAMATLITATAVGGTPARRGRRKAAAAAVLAIGGAAVLVDGAPGLGTDFGGVLALLPGIAVLAALLLGVRLTATRLVGIAALTLVVVSALAVADWARPAGERSHLGRFVQQVLDGDGGHVIADKAAANLGLLRVPIIVAVALPLLLVVLVALVRPESLRLHALVRAEQRDPALRALLIAALTTALLGFACNDSGVIVPAVALFTGGPLIVTVWAQHWLAEGSAATPSAAGRQRPAHMEELP